MANAPVKRTVKVSLQDVMGTLRTIHDKGDSDHFMSEAENAGALVTLPTKTLEFMKQYITDNKLARNSQTKWALRCKHPYKCDKAQD